MICRDQSDRGPLEKKRKKEKCGPLLTGRLDGARQKNLIPVESFRFHSAAIGCPTERDKSKDLPRKAKWFTYKTMCPIVMNTLLSCFKFYLLPSPCPGNYHINWKYFRKLKAVKYFSVGQAVE